MPWQKGRAARVLDAGYSYTTTAGANLQIIKKGDILLEEFSGANLLTVETAHRHGFNVCRRVEFNKTSDTLRTVVVYALRDSCAERKLPDGSLSLPNFFLRSRVSI